jgi:leader peptidase (prepilin peptidase)/N-methyltransferase
LYTKFGISSELLFYIIFSSFLITLAGIDIEWQILPDVLNYSLLIIGILANTIFFKALKESIIGAIIGFLFLYTIVFLSKGGMGFGDVKLGAALGASLGVKKIIETFFLAFLLGGIIGILLIVLKIKKGKDSIPFGPFLSLGAIITIIFEERIDELFIFFP